MSLASHEITYTLRDRLGSVVTLTDHNNNILEHRSYDPFGKPRYGTMLPSSAATLFDVVGSTPFTLRGFTDHEHIDEAQLIHMNGRVYDYKLGRFLSIDPLIQAPGNSQSLNPYSYIMNNPLAGTDPSGYASVGNLGFGEQQHCNFHCMIGYHGFTEAGSNGSQYQADITLTLDDKGERIPENIGAQASNEAQTLPLSPSEVIGDLWESAEFQRTLRAAEQEIADEVISESDRNGVLFNPSHANRAHGSVIRRGEDGTFKHSRPSVDVPNGTVNQPPSLRTGFMGGLTKVKGASVVIIGVGPTSRVSSIRNNATKYIDLAKYIGSPVIVVTTWREKGHMFIFNAAGEYSEMSPEERNEQ